MNTTFVSAAQTHLPDVGASLWLHIILSTIFACACVPGIMICKFGEYRYLRLFQILAIIVVFLTTCSSFLTNHGSPFTAHGALGLTILLTFGTFLIYDISHNRSQKLYSYLPDWKRLPTITAFVVALALAIEIMLGLTSLFNFCAYPYTQQCFGHIGIGGWFFLHFGFCAALSLADGTWLQRSPDKRAWTPEMADSVFIMPCGLGLAFFGHGWSDPWILETLQHVLLGVISILGSTLGLLLPQRTIFPGLIASLAGYTFLTHPQDSISPLLSNLHRGIGWLLCAIGVSRILDVGLAFNQPHEEERNLFASPWGGLASFAGVCAGLVIMSANAEEAELLDAVGAGSGVVFLGVFGVAMGIYAYLYLLVRGATSRQKIGYEAIEMEDA